MASTNVPLTSIGLYVGYAAVTSSDTLTTIPTTTFTHLPGLYSTPDFNIAPNTADATSYDEEESYQRNCNGGRNSVFIIR